MANQYTEKYDSLVEESIAKYYVECSEDYVSGGEKEPPRILLIKFLRFYYQCRVLRVRSHRVDTLRRIIWDICYDKLFTLDQEKNIISSTFHLNMEEMNEILICGTDLYDKESNTLRNSDHRLVALQKFTSIAKKLLLQASQILIQVSKTENTFWNYFIREPNYEESQERWKQNCLTLSEQIDTTLSSVLKISSFFCFVRLKCVVLKFSVHVSNNELECKDELYCWCRKIDDGSIMVCCENCEIWYHAACVNYPVERRRRKRKTNRETENYVEQTFSEFIGEKALVTADIELQDDAYVCIACCFSSNLEYKFKF